MSEPLRLVVVGDSGVGKTSLLLSWTTRCFTESYEPTVFENSRAHITLDGTPHELLLVDTTGSEEWDSLYPLWAAEIRKNAGPAGGFIVLVGTKSDMRTPATADPVTTSQGHVAATSSKIPVYLECSSKTQQGLDDVFYVGTQVALKKRAHMAMLESRQRGRTCVVC
eukprot:gnl/Spiro4/12047_TR6355_c0_g1_i1.p1 gnl/Spiro4/12047_TR6355_c0_g1~~gnl/Spiro4/12047_TR6355_c0_g1_i1.p1  ORF type:complete len:167 (-),score=34.88 gnl/Spiro4/12047_TR6355_c0_g1_i1:68-568(-)